MPRNFGYASRAILAKHPLQLGNGLGIQNTPPMAG